MKIIREEIEKGVKVLEIWRGIKELKVEMGGKIEKEIKGIEGRMENREKD